MQSQGSLNGEEEGGRVTTRETASWVRSDWPLLALKMEGAMRQGTWAALRSWTIRENRFFLEPLERNAVQLTSWFSPSETHVKFLTCRTVRSWICVMLLHLWKFVTPAKEANATTHVHESKDLILLVWQHSPNWSTNSIQFLSKSHLFLWRNWQVDSEIDLEIQETQNNQNNLGKE